MPDLDTLERRYRDAQDAYADDPTAKTHRAYRKAKLTFTDARVSQRQAEEADPDHPRGGDPNDPSDIGLAHVDQED